MPSLIPPAAAIAALKAACEPLFTMIESDPALFPLGAALIDALLTEARAQGLEHTLIFKTLTRRLAVLRQTPPRPAPQGPRHG